MQKVREQTEYEITCWQRAGLVVLKSLKLSGVSLILYQKLDKYVSSQPDFVVGNLLW